MRHLALESGFDIEELMERDETDARYPVPYALSDIISLCHARVYSDGRVGFTTQDNDRRMRWFPIENQTIRQSDNVKKCIIFKLVTKSRNVT